MDKSFNFAFRLKHAKSEDNRKGFTDCIVKCGGASFDAHRIVLSNASPVLYDYFTEHTEADPVYEFYCDCPKAMEKILNLLYEGEIHSSWEQIPYLMLIAYEWGMKPILALLETTLISMTDEKTFIPLLKIFKELNAGECAMSMVDFTASQLILSFIKYTDTIFTAQKYKDDALFTKSFCYKKPEKILEVIPGYKFFAQMLNSSSFSEILMSVTPLNGSAAGRTFEELRPLFNSPKESREFLLNLIDTVIGEGTDVDPEARMFIELVVGFGNNDYFDLVHHKCDWLSPRTARMLYNESINIRRNTIGVFTEDAQTYPDWISRWTPISWFTAVHTLEAVPVGTAPVYRLVDFISTIGGFTQRIDLEKYGMIGVAPIGMEHTSIQNFSGAVLDTDPSHFMLVSGPHEGNNVLPGFFFTLGRDKYFTFCKVIVTVVTDFMLRTKHNFYRKRKLPEKVVLSYLALDGSVVKVDGTLDKGEEANFIIQLDKMAGPCNGLTITVGSSDQILTMFRPSHIEVVGQFVP